MTEIEETERQRNRESQEETLKLGYERNGETERRRHR